MSEQLPSFVEERLRQISQTRQIAYEILLKEYAQTYDTHARNAEMTDEEKHRYAIMILWKDYVARPPAEIKQIIIAGIGGVRLTSTNKLQGEAMVLAPNTEKKLILRRLVLQESAIQFLPQLVQYAGYKVKLGEFAAGGDLVADDRADFSSPINTGLTFAKLMEQIRATRVPSLTEAIKYPSKVKSDGYPDTTDWKIVRGVVSNNPYVGERKDKKTRFGVYNIMDTSLGNQEPELTEDGQIIRPGFTVWCAPELCKWAKDSLLEFAGTIGTNQESKEVKKAREAAGKPAPKLTASMNGYVINPIAAERLQEKD